MNEDILVEAGNGRIVVRLRGTSMRAVYSKGDNPWLTLSEASDDKEAPISITEFRVLAWTAANEKARELGWIV